MLEGRRLEAVEENSRWTADLGAGVELSVELDSGEELFVVRTALEDVDEEIERWREELVGQEIQDTDEVVDLPLETGGRQVTLDITLQGGFTFEGDLIEAAERVETDEETLETEWTFEGTPGVEMGESQGAQRTQREGD